MPKIIVLSGSERAGSLNMKLADLAEKRLRAAGAAYVNASNNARATKNAWDWERFSPCLSFADSRALLNADRAARAAVIEMHARYITALYRWQGVNQPGGTR